ncbi:hypothetical protein E0Z10_g7831 [Xylaria hypoxylon]|uniref:Hydrophobin n=1 Tax=Xylaria hypoxylon TaxID=37992 RepID=A0A4Z0YN98_9PEZI|nr:hypothetical protein E0Z10_g7831 [Xylaria hypoxylon]
MLFLFVISLSCLSHLVAGAPEPKLALLPLIPSATGPLAPVFSLLGNIGNFEPPALLYTPNPSPECAKLKGGNGGQLQCCRAAVAGDQPIVEFLAKVYGYNLNRNDVNGLVWPGMGLQSPGDEIAVHMSSNQMYDDN